MMLLLTPRMLLLLLTPRIMLLLTSWILLLAPQNIGSILGANASLGRVKVAMGAMSDNDLDTTVLDGSDVNLTICDATVHSRHRLAPLARAFPFPPSPMGGPALVLPPLRTTNNLSAPSQG